MRAFLTAGGKRSDFDPVVEAAVYGLDGDEARAIWRRVQREASDDAAARRRFHHEARAAASPAPRPAIGRRTLVDAEAAVPRAVPRTPGRHSLISFAARREPVAIHRKAESSVVDAKAADLVAAARMGGHALDGALRARLEAALGAELGAVRVHTDEAADLAARALGARAFAIGEDIFFARGAHDQAMSNVTVDIRVDLVLARGVEELDEAAVVAQIAAGDTALLRDARALDGVIRIGGAEIADELFSAVQRLCFEAAVALLADGAVVEDGYFSSNEHARLAADGDTVMVSGSDVPESRFPRRDLIRALHACGVRWLAVLDRIGRAPEANHLRPFAAAAQSALAAAGLA